jgi:hypothetical protein
MVISNIKAKLYVLKLRTSTDKTWLLFVNVIQKFRKAVQMCVPPYIQAGHGTQLSKSVLSLQNRIVCDPYTCETLTNTPTIRDATPSFRGFAYSVFPTSRLPGYTGFLGEVSTCAGSCCLGYDQSAPICHLVGCQCVDRNP